MEVKISSKIYSSDKQPIMLILSDAEKELIANMAVEAHKFCVYPANSKTEKIKQFMDDVNENRKRV